MAISKQTVVELFESSIASATVLPPALVNAWFERAIYRYGFEVDEITYDVETNLLSTDLQIDADILALYMKLFYQEREYMRIGMRSQIVTKDISLNGGGAIYATAKNLIDDVRADIADLITKRKHPSIYTESATSDEDSEVSGE